jgi:hypothetical protein
MVSCSVFRVGSFSICPSWSFGRPVVHGMAMVVPFQRIRVVTTALQISKLEEQVGNYTADINSLKEKVSENTIDIHTMQRDNALAGINIMQNLDSKFDKLELMIKDKIHHVDVKFKNIDLKFDKFELMMKENFQHVDVKFMEMKNETKNATMEMKNDMKKASKQQSTTAIITTVVTVSGSIIAPFIAAWIRKHL